MVEYAVVVGEEVQASAATVHAGTRRVVEAEMRVREEKDL